MQIDGYVYAKLCKCQFAWSLSWVTEYRNAAAMVLPIYGGIGGGGLHPGGGGRIPGGGGRMPGGGGGPRICWCGPVHNHTSKYEHETTAIYTERLQKVYIIF